MKWTDMHSPSGEVLVRVQDAAIRPRWRVLVRGRLVEDGRGTHTLRAALPRMIARLRTQGLDVAAADLTRVNAMLDPTPE